VEGITTLMLIIMRDKIYYIYYNILYILYISFAVWEEGKRA